MSVNKERPHVLILIEDRANNDIVNGFVQHDSIDLRRIQALPYSGGWPKVLDDFLSDHVVEMQKNPNRYMVLLIDFDNRENRFDTMVKDIPDNIKERVFVIGVWLEAEDLPRVGLGSKEEVGMKLASECFDETRDVWNHELLIHNADELTRMATILRPILFP